MTIPFQSLGAALDQPQSYQVNGTLIKIKGNEATVQLSDGSILRRVAIAGNAAVGSPVVVEFKRGSQPVVQASGVSGGGSASALIVTGVGSGDGGGGLYVPLTRILTGTGGINTIGDLSTDRTVSVNQSYAFNWTGAQTWAAGTTFNAASISNSTFVFNGLTTFNAVATFTDGLSVSAGEVINFAPDVQVSRLASNVFGSSSDYAQFARVGAGVEPQNPLHARLSTGAQLRLDYDATYYADFTVGGGGNLTVAPVGDFVFAPAGDDINPQTTYRYNIGQPNLKYLTLHAAEAWFTTLVAEEHRSTVGGRQTIGPATELIAPLAATGTSYNTITVRTPTSSSTAGGSSYQTIAHVGSNSAGASGAGGLASISRVGVSRNDDYTNSLVVTAPSGVVDGNVLVCLVSWWAQTLTMPAGWTQQGSTATWTDANGDKYSRVYTRVASSEGASYTFGLDAVNDISVVITAYENVNTTTPVDVAISSNTQSTASTSMTADSITTVTAGAMVLYLAAPIDDTAGSTNVTAPTSFTEVSDTSNSIWTKSYVAERLYPSAGATGDISATLATARQSTSWLLALRPASGSSSTAATINVPSNTAGNTLIAMVAYTGTQALTPADGWTLLDARTAATGGILTYRRTIASGDPSSFTWTSDASTGALYGWISEYSGVDATAVAVLSSRANAASTTITSANITPSTSASMLMFGAAAIDTSAGSATGTPPSGMTERIDAGTGDIRVYLATELLSSAAQSGNRTATLSTSEVNLCVIIALPPAATTSTSSVTPAFPSGTTAGDVMIVAAAHAGTSTLTAPAGYTLAFQTTGVNGILDVYYRAIQTGDTAQAWSINTNGALGVSLSAFANVDTLAPFYFTGEYYSISNTASTSMTAVSISTSVANTVALFLGTAIDGSAGSSTITPPSGMTERLDAGAGDIRLYVATQAIAAIGPIGNRVATISTSEANIAALISLRPSASGGTTIDVKHNNLNAGDIVHLEARMRLEFMRITSSYSVISGGYRYSVIRDLDGTGANAWESGDGVFNTGQPGSGWIEAYSQSSMQSQAIDYVFNNDGGVFSANLNMEPNWEWWATIPVTNDAVYFGVTGTAWSNIFAYTVQAVAGTSIGATLEYWNGSAWTAVVGYTETNWLNNGGAFSIVWNAASQTGWAATTVNSVSAYWVRYRVTGGTWTQTARNGLRRVNRGTRQWGPTIAGWIRNSYTWNDFSPRWAIGNLDGLYDYGTRVYGFAAGDYNGAWISADATNGFRIMRQGTAKGRWDISGNITIGETGTSKANLYFNTTEGVLQFRSGTTSSINIHTDGSFRLKAGSSTASALTWWHNSFDDIGYAQNIVARQYAYRIAGYNFWEVIAEGTNGNNGWIGLSAQNATGTGVTRLVIDSSIRQVQAWGSLYATGAITGTSINVGLNPIYGTGTAINLSTSFQSLGAFPYGSVAIITITSSGAHNCALIVAAGYYQGVDYVFSGQQLANCGSLTASSWEITIVPNGFNSNVIFRADGTNLQVRRSTGTADTYTFRVLRLI